MSLRLEQIEHFGPANAGTRKRMKRERNKKIRLVPQDQIPNIKYNGWEY